MKILKSLTTKKGFTLIEVLATVVILGIISLLLFSIVSNGLSQYEKQTEKNQSLSKVASDLKVFTKDIRKGSQVTSDSSNSFFIDTHHFTFNNSTLFKNSEVYMSNIEKFEFTVLDGNTEVDSKNFNYLASGSMPSIIRFTIKLENNKSTQIVIRSEN